MAISSGFSAFLNNFPTTIHRGSHRPSIHLTGFCHNVGKFINGHLTALLPPRGSPSSSCDVRLKPIGRCDTSQQMPLHATHSTGNSKDLRTSRSIYVRITHREWAIGCVLEARGLQSTTECRVVFHSCYVHDDLACVDTSWQLQSSLARFMYHLPEKDREGSRFFLAECVRKTHN